MAFTNIPQPYSDQIHQAAKRAAADGQSLVYACAWPFDSWEGRLFKETFVMHRAALDALGLNDKTLTSD